MHHALLPPPRVCTHPGGTLLQTPWPLQIHDPATFPLTRPVSKTAHYPKQRCTNSVHHFPSWPPSAHTWVAHCSRVPGPSRPTILSPSQTPVLSQSWPTIQSKDESTPCVTSPAPFCTHLGGTLLQGPWPLQTHHPVTFPNTRTVSILAYYSKQRCINSMRHFPSRPPSAHLGGTLLRVAWPLQTHHPVTFPLTRPVTADHKCSDATTVVRCMPLELHAGNRVLNLVAGVTSSLTAPTHTALHSTSLPPPPPRAAAT
jgi:hypothetical protein